MHGHAGPINQTIAPLVPFIFIGFMGSFAISIASTALANEYVEDSQAKTITVFITVFYALGIILMCMWGCMNEESRKKFGKALYIGMVAAFSFTVVSDIIALVWWQDVQLDSFWEYPKGVSIAHFVITMLFSIGLSVCCAFFPKCMNKSQEDANKQVDVQIKAAQELATQMAAQMGNEMGNANNQAGASPG